MLTSAAFMETVKEHDDEKKEKERLIEEKKEQSKAKKIEIEKKKVDDEIRKENNKKIKEAQQVIKDKDRQANEIRIKEKKETATKKKIEMQESKKLKALQRQERAEAKGAALKKKSPCCGERGDRGSFWLGCMVVTSARTEGGYTVCVWVCLSYLLRRCTGALAVSRRSVCEHGWKVVRHYVCICCYFVRGRVFIFLCIHLDKIISATTNRILNQEHSLELYRMVVV